MGLGSRRVKVENVAVCNDTVCQPVLHRGMQAVLDFRECAWVWCAC